MTPAANLPTPDEIAAILKVTGKTTDDLYQDLVDRITAGLTSYVTMGDGEREEGYTVRSEFSRKIENHIDAAVKDVIAEQIAARAPDVWEELVATSTFATKFDTWGEPVGSSQRNVKDFILQELKSTIAGWYNRQGEGRNAKDPILDIVRREVAEQINAEARRDVDELRSKLAAAITRDTIDSVVAAAREAVPGLEIKVEAGETVVRGADLPVIDAAPKSDEDIPF